MVNRWWILFVLFFARLTMAFQFQSIAALSPLIVDSYQVGLAEIGFLIGLYLAPGVILAIPGGAIAARFGGQADRGPGHGVDAGGGHHHPYGIGVVFVLNVPTGAVVPVVIVMGVLSALGAGPVMTLPSVILPPAARSFGMGVFFSIYYGVIMVALPLAGGAADRSGNAGVAFIIGAALLVICIAALIGFRRVSVPQPARA